MKINKTLLCALLVASILATGCKTHQSLRTSCSANFTYGIPSQEDCIINRTGYALGFRDADKQPAWVQYRLTSEMMKLRDELKLQRTNDFKADPLVPTGSATPEDYVRSGYDKGHLAPAADMSWSTNTLSESFYMSNMSPQKPVCNRKIWLDLERAVRDFAKREKSVFIITGPVFSTNEIKHTIGKVNKVTVPDAFYKAIYAENSNRMIGFIIPNCSTTNSIVFFSCSVDEIERQTLLDLFSGMSIEKQEEFESNLDSDFFFEK